MIDLQQSGKVNVFFGAMAPSLNKQLPMATRLDQRQADAITYLHVNGLLSDSETDRVRRRLLKKIVGR